MGGDVVAPPEIARIVRDEFVGAVRPGIEGISQEAMCYERPWGFDLGEIEHPVHVYQGERAVNVPPAMGRYLACELPAARATFYPDEGHLSTLVHNTEGILAALLE